MVGCVHDYTVAPPHELLRHIRQMLPDRSRIGRIDLGDNEKGAASIHGDCDITRIVIAKLLVVSAAWLVVSVLLGGVGALVRRLFGSPAIDESDVILDWWIGWAFTVAFLLAWHLALAITTLTWIPIAVAGATGVWMARKDWTRAIQPVLQGGMWLAVTLVVAWLAVAALTFGPERQYDTALYHLQSVRWAQAYPVVPGLANLDTRFAMNSTFFLFGALVETVRVGDTNLRLAAGLLFLPLIVQGIIALYAGVMARGKMDVRRWFQILMMPVALWQAHQYSSSLSPDGVVFVLSVVLSAELLRILYRDERVTERHEVEVEWDYRLFGILLLVVTGITVKVSFAAFGFAVAAVALWKWSSVRSSRWIPLTRIVAPAILVAAVWIIHGVILSGYVAYPSPTGSFPVDWKVPHSVVERELDWIVAWARSPGMRPRDVLGNNEWLGRWLANAARDRNVIAAAFTLVLAGALRIGSRRPREQTTDPPSPNAFVFLLPSLLALGVWFVTAPAIRFTLGPLWVIAVGRLALSAARSRYLSLDATRARIAMRIGLVLVLGAACVVGLNESGSTPAPHPLRQITTLSGLTVYVPVGSDQCGDAPLPCSSHAPNQRLELREPGSIAKGFRVAHDTARRYFRMNTPTESENNSRK